MVVGLDEIVRERLSRDASAASSALIFETEEAIKASVRSDACFKKPGTANHNTMYICSEHIKMNYIKRMKMVFSVSTVFLFIHKKKEKDS